MRTSLRIAFAIALVLGHAPLARAGEVPLQTVHFEIDYLTVFGQSVFVLGDIPELGAGDVTRAVKLVPGVFTPGHLPWSIDLAIPQGTTYSWRFVLRNDAVSELSKPTNGTDISAAQLSFTADPTPPTRNLALFVSTLDGASTVSFNTPGGSILRPLRPVPDTGDFHVAVLSGQPNGDGISAQVLGTTIATPIHSLLYRAGELYNYTATSSANPAGVKTTLAVPSAVVPATRTVNGVTGRGIQVWTPRAYSANPTRRYPVLYMHDGQNVFVPGGPFGSWQAELVAAAEIKAGRARELIIVAIDNSSLRLTEYNPEWGASSVDNDDYNFFLVNELKPYIDANFRTLTGPQDTGILGSSFGGVASLSAALAHPEVFGRCGALSTSFWATTFDNALAAGALLPATRLYVDCGDQGDDAANNIAARDGTLAAGRTLHGNFFFTIGYGDAHNEAAWNRRLPGALRALFPITDEPGGITLAAPIVSDIDGSGCVDLSDLGALLAAYGACSGAPEYVHGADLDANGCIDLSDLGLMLAEYDAGCS